MVCGVLKKSRFGSGGLLFFYFKKVFFLYYLACLLCLTFCNQKVTKSFGGEELALFYLNIIPAFQHRRAQTASPPSPQGYI